MTRIYIYAIILLFQLSALSFFVYKEWIEPSLTEVNKGQVWKQDFGSDNPFKKSSVYYRTVKDVKDGYVQWYFSDLDSTYLYSDSKKRFLRYSTKISDTPIIIKP